MLKQTPLSIGTSAIRSLQVLIDCPVGLESAHACLRNLLVLETLEIYVDLREYLFSKGLVDVYNDIHWGPVSEKIIAKLFRSEPKLTDSNDTAPECSDRAMRIPVRVLRLKGLHFHPQPPEQGTSIGSFLALFNTLEPLVISARKAETLEPSLMAVAIHGRLRSPYLNCKFVSTGSVSTFQGRL